MRPLLWTVGRTGGKNVTDIAKNKSPDVSAEDLSNHVGDAITESRRHLIGKLRGSSLKRVRRVAPKKKTQGGKKPKKSPAKRARVIKKGYLLLVLISHIMSAAEIVSIISLLDIFAHKPVQTSVLGTI